MISNRYCSSPIDDCPCRARRNPALQVETRMQPECTTAKLTTSTTTTTTTTTAIPIPTITTTITTTTTTTTATTVTTATTATPSTSLVVVEDTRIYGNATAGSRVILTSTVFPAASTSARPRQPRPSPRPLGEDQQVQQQQQQQQQQTSVGVSGTTIAVIVMGSLALVGIGAALHIRAANRRQKEDAAAAAAAAAAVYHGNPVFQRGERVDYLEPDSTQPGVYAKEKAKVHEYAEASALVQNATAELGSDGYVVDHCNPNDLGRRADLLKDSNGYVVDDFNPNDIGRCATINVGTRHAIYATPVAEDERAAVIANTTYGQPNAVVPVPVSPPLRSNTKKHQASVYDGFGGGSGERSDTEEEC